MTVVSGFSLDFPSQPAMEKPMPAVRSRTAIFFIMEIALFCIILSPQKNEFIVKIYMYAETGNLRDYYKVE